MTKGISWHSVDVLDGTISPLTQSLAMLCKMQSLFFNKTCLFDSDICNIIMQVKDYREELLFTTMQVKD